MTDSTPIRLTLEQLERLESAGWVSLHFSDLWEGLYQVALNLSLEKKFKSALIKDKVTTEIIRNDVTYWLDEKTESLCEKKFLNLIESIKSELQNYFRLSLSNFETHYAIYDKDQFYKRHSDQKKTDNKRAFSFVYYLNKNWAPSNGGQLIGYLEDSENELFKIQPEAGTFILFKSDIEHQVLTSHAPRFSVTGWIRTL
jgi:SM-20-related protein